MCRRKKDPLRPLTDDERETLSQLSRSHAAAAAEVARAKLLLLVAGGSGCFRRWQRQKLRGRSAVSPSRQSSETRDSKML
jgi:hypothetical protein